MFHRFNGSTKLAGLVTFFMMFGFVQSGQTQITVKVNDSLVPFDRVGPKEINGSVFIPLRAVGESMGVDIHWEEATQTITGSKSPHMFVLRLGSRAATVDEREVTLNSPARTINGVTMVPLRFVAEALGAEVRWRSDISQVTITTDSTTPAPTPLPRVTSVTGEVVGLQSKGNSPFITVRTPNGRTRFDITRETVILRGLSNERGRPVELEEIVLGNSVEIKPDPSGSLALTIKELVAQPIPTTRVTGEIISIQPRGNPPTISLNTANGRVRYEITPDTIILSGPAGSAGIQTELDKLRVDGKVDIRTDASGSVAVSIRENLPVPVVVAPPVRSVPPTNKPLINSLQITRANMMRAGSRVGVYLNGTPGGTATFSVGSLAKDIPMHEDPNQPGSYSGTFSAPRFVTAMGLGVFGGLRVGEQTAPGVQAQLLVNIDSEPPRINFFAPEDRSTVMNERPEIYAEISDGVAGSGIDTESVQLLVGGQDVTSRARIANHLIMYIPPVPLPLGNTDVSLTVSDKAGNETRASWNFRVAAPPAVLQAVSHDSRKPVLSGEEVVVQARGLPGGNASFSIPSLLNKIVMREISAGLYEGRFKASNGMVANHAPVVVDFTAGDGRSARLAAPLPLTVATVPPPQPTIIAPIDNFVLTPTMVVTGTGRSGDTVTVTVGFSGNVGATVMKGSLGTFTTTVDKNGQWQTPPITVNLPFGMKPPTLQITAVASDVATQRSKTTVIDIRTR